MHPELVPNMQMLDLCFVHLSRQQQFVPVDPLETSATELPDASTTRALAAGALSSGGNAVPTVVVAAKSNVSALV